MNRYFGKEKPSLDVISHYGIKGMKWGVRKEEDTGGGSGSSGDYKASHKAKPTPSVKDGAANLAKNEAKFKDKFKGSGDKAPGKVKTFVSKHKKAVVIGGAIAAILVAGYVNEKMTEKSIKEKSGKKISSEDFAKHVNHSKMKTWATDDYFKGDAFDRPEFSLPVGHTFHRISEKAETSYNDGTYAVHSKADYDRYIAQFRQEKSTTVGGGLQHITFQAKEEVKVPNLGTVLDTLKGVLSHEEPSANWMDEHVTAAYQDMSGGDWRGSRARGFFDALEKKGYGAIVDEMDAGVIGETPLVVFAKSLLGEKSSTKISESDIDHSESNLIEIDNRKY